MPQHGSKTSAVPVVWAILEIFLAQSKWFPVAIGDHGKNLVISLWQSNNQWSGGIAAHPALPQKIPSAKIHWKSSRLDFFGIKAASSSLSSKGPNYQRGVLLICAGAIEGHFEGKTPRAGRSSRGSCSCATMLRLTEHLQPRKNWPTLASHVLVTHPILQIWPWIKKAIERSPFFVWRRGHCCRGDLVGWTTFWIFLGGLRKLE